MKAQKSIYEIRVQRLNETPDAPKLDSPETAFQYWQDVITKMPWYIPDREVCVAIMLNTRLRVTRRQARPRRRIETGAWRGITL